MTAATLTLAELPARWSKRISIAADGCWLWSGALNRNGYGITTRPNSSRKSVVHRLVYEIGVGPIPEGLDLDHLCRVRNCVNPAHLEPVTRGENLRRGKTVTAASVRATECPQGHPYSGDNLYVNQKGHRSCRTCHREMVAAARKSHPDQAARLAKHREYDARYRAKKYAERAKLQ